MTFRLIGIAFISFLITYIGIYFLHKNFKKFFIQKPNLRSSHILPKPSGGGIIFAATITLSLFILDENLGLICLPLAIIGFLDDIFNLNKGLRYISQVFTSILIIYNNKIILNYISDFGLISSIFLSFIVILFITSIINFTNFMDGIDGLVCSCLIVVFIVCAIKINATPLVIVSSLCAFLLWNWYPSKIFMGDVGSTFLGALFAGYLLKIHSYQFLMILIVSLPLFLDSFTCVIRRIYLKEPFLEAHCSHLYQRLYQAGWKHSKITIFYLSVSIILGIFVIIESIPLLIISILSIILVGIYLDQNVAVPFKLASKKRKNNF